MSEGADCAWVIEGHVRSQKEHLTFELGLGLSEELDRALPLDPWRCHSDMLDPSTNELDECRPLGREVQLVTEPDQGAIGSEPLEHGVGVFNLEIWRILTAYLGTEMEDDAEPLLLPEIDSREVLVSAEAGSVPLDTISDGRISF